MIIQEIMKVCQSADKGGYNQFDFTKSDGVTVAPKIAYSEIYEPWGWIISTGNYIDDMDLAKQDMAAAIDKEYKGALMRTDIVFIAVILVSIITAYIVSQAYCRSVKENSAFCREDFRGKSDYGRRRKQQDGNRADGNVLTDCTE